MRRDKPFVIGLTGSIGMGKTTTAQMFRDLGIAVWDADAAVERLYSKNGDGVKLVGQLCPQAVTDGAVDREVLRNWIMGDEAALEKLESAIHPLVGQDRKSFLEKADTDIVVLDIPLLFETGSEHLVDLTAVVSAPEAMQRDRVLARPGMTEARLEKILARQLPDKEKRARADVVIPTSSLEETRKAVQKLVQSIREDLQHARNRS